MKCVPPLFFLADGRVRIGPTCVMVVMVSILAATQSSFGFLTYQSKDVLQVVVPVAGTIVALALPAAQLAQTIVDNVLSVAQQLVKANQPIADVVNYLSTEVTSRRRDLEAMKWVVLFGLASFLTGLGGIFGIFSKVLIAPDIGMTDFIACLSTALLVASVLWFLPVVRSSFDLAKVDRFIKTLDKSK